MIFAENYGRLADVVVAQRYFVGYVGIIVVYLSVRFDIVCVYQLLQLLVVIRVLDLGVTAEYFDYRADEY